MKRLPGGVRAALVTLLAGAAGALAFPPLCLVPVLALVFPVLLRRVDAARTWRGAFGYGFVFGLGLHTAGLYWLTNAILIRAADFWWLVPVAAPGCALILAPFAAVPAAVCRLVPAGPRRAVLFAGLWTLADMGRVFLFTGFPWNPLGSAWEWPGRAGQVMIQPAAWIGVDGLTLLTVLMATLVPYGRRTRLALAAMMMVWGAAGTLRLAIVRPREVPMPAVALVQGNISEETKIARDDPLGIFHTYLDLTAEGTARARQLGRPDVVFAWPETAFPYVLDREPAAQAMIARAGGGATGLIGTLRIGPGEDWHNAIEAIDAGGTVRAHYDKSTLVPFGEYNPALLPFHVVPGGGFVPGHGVTTWHLPGAGAVGPLICYEVIFSGRVVDRRDRPDWLVNVTNDAWYGDSAGPRQHLASVRMRAVEEGMPIARAANTGISAVYGPTGREIARLGWGRRGTLVAALPAPLPPTVFALAGRSIPLGMALAACALALVRPRKRQSARLSQ
ncbi:apolipoprotein N-acyltransferase [Ameyamaea chiangmaiensis NBRC 103196]|uniref:apolipoprotein N-acyltransferase n=1 Tax=Ameyamaea chiangmaiensis TaxID=442969 RepID=UPI001C3FF957|nr:apolipoprotein N-acyltransferase [Ameyamaea chiangmaiensis]GBQ65677.1 apolipoprotein N-acyltransferase [Ameyamaea chiangmaiensis NBRC 103196]